MKKVLLIATGGTISQTKTELGLAPDKNKTATLLSQKLHNLCEIHIIDLFNIDSGNITPNHWVEIADCVRKYYDEYDGFVIAHGTDTLAYTASALSYSCGYLNKPVAITGAQIPYGVLGTDANNNLFNAFKSVCDGKIIGVYVVFGPNIISGTRAKKLSEFEVNAFAPSNGKLLAEIGIYMKYLDDAIIKHNGYFNNDRFINNFNAKNLLVANLYPGFNPELVKLGVDQGMLKAVLLRTYADGNTSIEALEDMYKYLQEKQIPVCHISQPDKGCTTMSTYETAIRAVALGVIPTYDMTTESLTVKMSWALGQTLDYKEFGEVIKTNIVGEIDEALMKQ